MRSAMVWNALNLAVGQIGGLVVFLVLARELGPELFGVFAAATLVTDLIAIYGKSAVVDALVIRGWTGPRERSAVFWWACLAALAAALVTAAIGYMAQPLFGMAALGATTAALAALFALAPAQAVMEAELFGQMQVRSLAIRNIVTTVAAGAVGVAAAFGPWPEWALVAQRAMQGVASVALLWLATKFAPAAPAALAPGAAASFFGTAGRIWVNYLLALWPRSIGIVISGSAFGAAGAGAYQVLERLQLVGIQLFLAPSSGLVVPALSDAGASPAQRTDIAMALLRNAVVFCAPAFAGLALLGGDLVGLVLGEAYAPHAGLLSMLAIAGLFAPFTAFRFAVLSVRREGGWLTGLLLIEAPIAAAAMWIGGGYGLAGVGAGFAIVAALGAITGIWLILRTLEAPVGRLLAAVGPAYLGAGAMAAAVVLAGAIAPTPENPALAAAVFLAKAAFGAAIYGGYLYAAHGRWLASTLRALRPRGGGAQGAES